MTGLLPPPANSVFPFHTVDSTEINKTIHISKCRCCYLEKISNKSQLQSIIPLSGAIYSYSNRVTAFKLVLFPFRLQFGFVTIFNNECKIIDEA